MKSPYPHLLSPVMLGNNVLKSHIIGLPCRPPFLQGGEPHPTDTIISHYINRARDGIGLITMSGTKVSLKIAHNWEWDFFDEFAQHYISMFTDAVHGFGTKCTMTLGPDIPEGFDVSDGVPSFWVHGDGSKPEYGKEMPEKMMIDVSDEMVRLAVVIRELGFDGVYIHNAYCINMGRFLSPITNKRTDKYGGSFENRIRYPLYVMNRIKENCGKDFIIETTVTADESEEGGWTMEDTIQYAEALEGSADLLQVRPQDVDMSSVLAFHPGRTPWLPLAEEVKARANTSVKIVAMGGLYDLEENDRIIAEGRVDFIGIARGMIADPEYCKKAEEGRADDIVPCLRCNKCHKSSMADPWIPVCSVNPKWGIEHRLPEIVTIPECTKKVAVIGGGPSGMNSAIICAQRRHNVTLFEKADHLGGQLDAAGAPSFKWPIRDFKEYLVRQVKKNRITVRLKTEVTPGQIEQEDYDVVVACVGSSPLIPPIPGSQGGNVMTVRDVFGNEGKLGKKVVIIGGGEIGVETGMYLAEMDHDITVLEMLPVLAKDTPPVHYHSVFKAAWEALSNFHSIVNAKCSKIEDGQVGYIDDKGIEQTIAADSVVLAVGSVANSDMAIKFFGSAPKFYMLGDCEKPGNIHKAMRRSFITANQI